jgi:hypothetical protein
VKPVLKAPGIMLLKLRYGEPVSGFAFNFNLRRYTAGSVASLHSMEAEEEVAEEEEEADAVNTIGDVGRTGPIPKFTAAPDADAAVAATATETASPRASSGSRKRVAMSSPAVGLCMQVEPMKPALKVLGSIDSKLRYDELLSKFAFNFNLRRYTAAGSTGGSKRAAVSFAIGEAAVTAGAYTRSLFSST